MPGTTDVFVNGQPQYIVVKSAKVYGFQMTIKPIKEKNIVYFLFSKAPSKCIHIH